MVVGEHYADRALRPSMGTERHGWPVRSGRGRADRKIDAILPGPSIPGTRGALAGTANTEDFRSALVDRSRYCVLGVPANTSPRQGGWSGRLAGGGGGVG